MGISPAHAGDGLNVVTGPARGGGQSGSEAVPAQRGEVGITGALTGAADHLTYGGRRQSLIVHVVMAIHPP